MNTTTRLFALALALTLSACGEYSTELPSTSSTTPPPSQTPPSTACAQEFQTTVFPILDKPERCLNCHTPSNIGAAVFNMAGNDAAAFTLFSQTAQKLGANGESLMLLKPRGLEGHGGGDRFLTLGTSDPDYIAIQTLTDKILTAQCQ
ncbi:MAG: hypothetical protein ACR2RB_18255 [Gammaproteobacteria bacterium]